MVRYIVQDDRAQAAKANRAIALLTPEEPGFISAIVLCELNWVLKSAYEIAKADCVTTLERITAVSVFEIEHIDPCRRALRAYKEGTADFSDYLIREIALASGCTGVLTFDKNALKADGFEKL
ncbi:MAG: type II toxin-antitoxin system VapC family toxin [Candidatus Hydrogenedentes bacterium]|nr:type II toxin-antitoxin system VapC family toxin [Candidatus Hydrogenedentota bacterium]